VVTTDLVAWVATELSDGVHQVFWHSSDKLEFTVLWSHQSLASYNFAFWCFTGPVSLVAVDVSVPDQLESVIAFVLHSTDLCGPVTFVMEPVVSAILDLRYMVTVVICWRGDWCYRWEGNLIASCTSERISASACECVVNNITHANTPILTWTGCTWIRNWYLALEVVRYLCAYFIRTASSSVALEEVWCNARAGD